MIPQSVTHVANGASVAFTFPFSIFEPLDLEVLVNGVVQSAGFSLVGVGSASGGAVRFDSAPADTTVVTLRRTGKVQVSGSDAPGFLEAKIVAGANITVTKTTDAAGEHLAIASTVDPAAFATAAQGAKADSALQSSAIGVSLQAHDADLDWLAGNITAAGKALLDDADAAAQRVTLGLAAVASSGAYNDLANKPTLGSSAALDIDTDGTLAANSNAKLPSQKAVKTYVDTMASSAVQGMHIQVFTASGTFTAPAGTTTSTAFKFTLVGGGGGGGCNTSSQSHGGGGSATAIYYASGLSAGQTVSVTVGAGGQGGQSNGDNGAAGGASVIVVGATTVTAGGGTGGYASQGSEFVTPGGSATNGTINITGGSSQCGQNSHAINGGSSTMGNGGSYAGGVANQHGTGYGGGGAGTAGGSPAGNGTPGIVFVEWVL